MKIVDSFGVSAKRDSNAFLLELGAEFSGSRAQVFVSKLWINSQLQRVPGFSTS